MSIIIVGWGSLIWKTASLPIASDWKTGGPVLPLEFSRVSSNRKLTLVLDPENGTDCSTRFAFSARSNLADAIRDLRDREETAEEYIGFLDLRQQISSTQAYPQQINVEAAVRQWCSEYDFSTVIWTALQPNFWKSLGVPFSIEAAIDYLKDLPPSDRTSALDYFHQTPAEVQTPLRHCLAAQWKNDLDSSSHP